jgi:hypothetical protein
MVKRLAVKVWASDQSVHDRPPLVLICGRRQVQELGAFPRIHLGLIRRILPSVVGIVV